MVLLGHTYFLVICSDVSIYLSILFLISKNAKQHDFCEKHNIYSSDVILSCLPISLLQVLRFQRTYKLINALLLTDAYSCRPLRIEFIPKCSKNNSKQTPEHAKRNCACYSKAYHQVHWSIYWIRA